MEILFLIGRVLFGGYFVINGFNHFMKVGMMTGYAQSKGVPAAGAAVIVTGLMLFLGGLGFLLGVWIEWAAALVTIFLVVAAFKMHNFWADADPQMKMMNMMGFMRNLALSGAALMALSIPQPWAWGFL